MGVGGGGVEMKHSKIMVEMTCHFGTCAGRRKK